jgi:hypothetical protein
MNEGKEKMDVNTTELDILLTVIKEDFNSGWLYIKRESVVTTCETKAAEKEKAAREHASSDGGHFLTA